MGLFERFHCQFPVRCAHPELHSGLPCDAGESELSGTVGQANCGTRRGVLQGFNLWNRYQTGGSVLSGGDAFCRSPRRFAHTDIAERIEWLESLLLNTC
ncbi:hypothetical protein Mal35_07110 [Gimesia maris]|nr:hypothetical protein Mal35_07110 [Gimesia maris]